LVILPQQSQRGSSIRICCSIKDLMFRASALG
jgi:hypothetical protein